MVNQITVQELSKRLYNNEIRIIDVREDFEIKICSIKDSIHIPIKQIPNEISKLSDKTNYALICHSGVRSYHACEYLSQNGKSVYNVVGGIDEWAASIDNDMKRY